ncbi:MAG: MarR family transcriptional regulator [Rhizobiales bacterium]|nr:MarR family transcriptional regulator [Hyphomicrobiales bacterium]
MPSVAAEEVDFGVLENWVGFQLRMAQSASFQAFARLSHQSGMRPGRFATLYLIGRNPGISQTALSRANGKDKSSLTPVLNDLVRRGFVHRARTRNDRRTYRLTLTPDGRKLLDQLNRCAQRHDRNLDRLIGRRDVPRFLEILRKIATEIA